jgi:hypothetical protein
MDEACRGGANSAARPSYHHDEAEDVFHNESEMVVVFAAVFRPVTTCCTVLTGVGFSEDLQTAFIFKIHSLQ